MAASSYVFTIAYAAQTLDEDEQLLSDLAIDMDPEDGCLWVYGADDHQTMAFTEHGLEYLREPLAEHKRSKTSSRP